MQSGHPSPTPAPLAPWFPRGVTLLQNPELNKGTAFSEAERDALGLKGLLPPHVCSQAEQVRPRPRQLSSARQPAREVHLHDLAARPQRGALLSHRHREPGRDDADHLHADGGPRVPEVRPHLPAAARRLRHRQRPRQGEGAPAQLAASRRRDDRRHRRRADPRPRRSRLERHGDPGRQALALHRLRRNPPVAVPAGDARRRHQQPGAARRPALPRPAPSRASPAPPTTSWWTSSSPPPARSSRGWWCSSRTSPTTTRFAC